MKPVYTVNIDGFATKEVANLAEAARAVRKYLDAAGIGASQWGVVGDAAGLVTATDTGLPVARISYNGRIWSVVSDRTEYVGPYTPADARPALRPAAVHFRCDDLFAGTADEKPGQLNLF